jgi:integrase
METINKRGAWNKGKLVGHKPPLKPKDIWAIRIYLQNAHAVRDLAMFNLAIDSKLRGCDLVSLRVRDVTHGNQVLPRTMVIQRKTQRPVPFELTEPTRAEVSAWLEKSHLRGDQFLFPSRVAKSPHVSTRQYARIVHHWAESAGLDSSAYGTHSMRRTKATLIYKRTKNLRAVQLLLGHSKLESTVRYLGIEVDDALEISEQLHKHITRAAAFWHHVEFVLSATTCRSSVPRRCHSRGSSTPEPDGVPTQARRPEQPWTQILFANGFARPNCP